MRGIVLVKAQATKQKGIAMRLFLGTLSALLMSAAVTTAQEIRGACTITHGFSVKGSEAVVKQFPEVAGTQLFFQINGDTLLFRAGEFVDQFQQIGSTYLLETFIENERISTRRILQVVDPACEGISKDRSLVMSSFEPDVIRRFMADCPCNE